MRHYNPTPPATLIISHRSFKSRCYTNYSFNIFLRIRDMATYGPGFSLSHSDSISLKTIINKSTNPTGIRKSGCPVKSGVDITVNLGVSLATTDLQPQAPFRPPVKTAAGKRAPIKLKTTKNTVDLKTDTPVQTPDYPEWMTGVDLIDKNLEKEMQESDRHHMAVHIKITKQYCRSEKGTYRCPSN